MLNRLFEPRAGNTETTLIKDIRMFQIVSCLTFQSRRLLDAQRIITIALSKDRKAFFKGEGSVYLTFYHRDRAIWVIGFIGHFPILLRTSLNYWC